MLIAVTYPNGSYDLVKDFYLDYLISAEKITSFKRSNGWVNISDANIRGKKTASKYPGRERRQSLLSENSGEPTMPSTEQFFAKPNADGKTNLF